MVILWLYWKTIPIIVSRGRVRGWMIMSISFRCCGPIATVAVRGGMFHRPLHVTCGVNKRNQATEKEADA